MNDSILKKTANWYRCVGVLSEKNLSMDDCQVKIYEDGKDTGEKVNAQCVKGSITVRVPSGVITFPVYFSSKGLDGKDSKFWGMAKAMFEKWNPEIDGNDEDPTVIALEGVIEGNDYLSQTGEAKYQLRYRVRRANTRVQPDEAHGMTISTTAFINAIKHEVKGSDAEETGRLSVELYGANNKGACFPINCFVEEEYADDFENIYEAGQTVAFDIDVINHHVGAKNEGKKKAFGRGGSINTNTGYDVTELMIVGADDPIEEPEELTYEDDEGNIKEVETDWINPTTMKKAQKQRNVEIKAMVARGPEDKDSHSGGGKSIKERKAERKMAKPKNKPVNFDDDDSDDDPF